MVKKKVLGFIGQRMDINNTSTNTTKEKNMVSTLDGIHLDKWLNNQLIQVVENRETT